MDRSGNWCKWVYFNEQQKPGHKIERCFQNCCSEFLITEEQSLSWIDIWRNDLTEIKKCSSSSCLSKKGQYK